MRYMNLCVAALMVLTFGIHLSEGSWWKTLIDLILCVANLICYLGAETHEQSPHL